MSENETTLIWLLIENEDSVLVAKRKPNESPFGGHWTLPGVELKQGESASKVVAEHAEDQLDVQIMGNEPFQTLRLEDGAAQYAVAVHRVGYEGQPRFRESGPYSEVGWAPRGELMDEKAFPYLSELAGYLTGTV